jgi:eukaryotic-like serine/threonine-protein kinase
MRRKPEEGGGTAVKQRVWSKDWFFALVFSIVFAIVAFGIYRDSFQGLERYAYDLGVSARDRTPSDKVAVIAIDDESIRNLGRWPWPRNLHAAMNDLLREGGARVVGNTIFYFEDQIDPGQRYLDEIADLLENSTLGGQAVAEIVTIGAMLDDAARSQRAVEPIALSFRESGLATQVQADLETLAAKVGEARSVVAADDLLSASMAQGPKTILGMVFQLGVPSGRPDQPLPDYVRRNALTRVVDRVNAVSSDWLPVPTREQVLFPVPALGSKAAGIAHMTETPDVDGGKRFEPLVLQHFDQYYPSMSLLLAAQALNLGPDDIEVRLGEGVALGGIEIRTRSDLLMYTHYYGNVGGRPPFRVDSFFDVFTGKIPASSYRGMVVLIGPTAVGLGESFRTPVSVAMPPVETLAHAVSSILQQDFFTRPAWAGWFELGIYLLITVYLAVAVPVLGPGLAALLSGGGAVVLAVTELSLLAGNAVWLKLMIPLTLLLSGHLVMTVKRLRLTEKLKLSSEAEGAESNRMLGLAFQGQGQLDMAFEKFRRVQPVDDRVLDLIYNLALDFERKRQFNKAESAYQYIARHNPKFRDVDQKTALAKKLSETVILGGGASSSAASSTMVLDATAKMEKPMLGRYQVEKELGKGAMGVVYMGKDPKINRIVAIKTMAITQEFEPDEVADVKARFFREAETAGRLNHPNIVSIYDAGEEHDLCYIAMEFLKGHDLTRYTKPNSLLPVKDVLKFMAEAADALDYAHQQNVVHRDIKPANLMMIEASRVVKITDFGIARITDASKTKTGMVLGTPSYMSPEQLAGKKVDGRSDLFSLGVTLYQLLTGTLPFHADSMATLMFKIANEPHAQITVTRPDLPAALNAIINRVLQKELDRRYARGSELSQDLRAVMATLG